MWPSVKWISGVALAGCFALAGMLAGPAGAEVAYQSGRPIPYSYYGPYGDPLAFSPAPYWNWNAGGYVGGLYYNPYWCYAPGSCVFGYH